MSLPSFIRTACYRFNSVHCSLFPIAPSASIIILTRINNKDTCIIPTTTTTTYISKKEKKTNERTPLPPCQEARYCNLECGKEHWRHPTASHKDECKAAAAAAARRRSSSGGSAPRSNEDKDGDAAAAAGGGGGGGGQDRQKKSTRVNPPDDMHQQPVNPADVDTLAGQLSAAASPDQKRILLGRDVLAPSIRLLFVVHSLDLLTAPLSEKRK